MCTVGGGDLLNLQQLSDCRDRNGQDIYVKIGASGLNGKGNKLMNVKNNVWFAFLNFKNGLIKVGHYVNLLH